MGPLALDLNRLLPAPRPVVFAAFTDRDELVRWWGPEGFEVATERFDPVPDAAYRIEMRPPASDPFHLNGRFQTVTPPTRLSFTFAWDPPDPDDVENVVVLEFKERGDATEVLLRQLPFRTEARRDLHRDGWTESFDKLERLLAA